MGWLLPLVAVALPPPPFAAACALHLRRMALVMLAVFAGQCIRRCAPSREQ